MDGLLENKILWKKIGIIIGVYLTMKYLVPLVIPFLLAGLLVCWCRPILVWMREKLHIWPSLVMGVLLLLCILLLFIGFYAAGQKLMELAPRFFSSLACQNPLEQLLYKGCQRAGEWLHLETDGVQVFVAKQMNVFLDGAREKILPGALDGSWQILKGAGSFFAGLLVMGVAAILLAADYEKIRKMGKRFPLYEKAMGTLRGILSSVGMYLRAQCMIMGVVMLICMAGIWLSGRAASPVSIGILVGLLDALPVFGTGTVFLPWVAVCIFRGNYGSAVILAATYALCMLARELLEPKLIGTRLGILPVVILASVYAGVKIYGAGGILLGPLSVLFIKELWQRL